MEPALQAILVLCVAAGIVDHEIVYVPDGDGLLVRHVPTGTTRMTRLCGVDCPEIGQQGKTEARRFLLALLAQNAYLLHTYPTPDCHGRALVSLFAQDTRRSVAALLVEHGLCFVYECYVDACLDRDQILLARLAVKSRFVPARPARRLSSIRHGTRASASTARVQANATDARASPGRRVAYPRREIASLDPWTYRRTVERITNKSFLASCRSL